MKKLLILLTLFICLSACTTRKANSFDINCKDVDMSVYEGVDGEHCFKETTVSELTRTINEKGSAPFYLGYKECAHCQELVRYLNEVGLELGVTIYYLAGTDEKGEFTIVGDIYDELLNDLEPILDEDDKGIYTPNVFNVIDGEIVKSKISGSVDSAKQIEDLKNEYRKILEPFK